MDSCNVAVDEREVRDVSSHHGTRANEGIAPDSDSTDNCGVRSKRRSLLDECRAIFVFTADMTARIHDVRKDHGGTTKDVILQNTAGVNGDVVLNLDVASEHNVWRNNYVLTYITAFADPAVLHYVREVPDLRAGAYFARFIYICGLMNKCLGVDH